MSGALSAALALMLLSLTGGALRLWGPDGPTIFPSGSYGFIGGLSLALLSLIVALIRTRSDTPSLQSRWPRLSKLSALASVSHWGNPWIWSCGLIAVFASEWLCRRYVLLQGPLIRGELLLFFLISFASLPYIKSWTWRLLPVGAAALLFWSFFDAAQGRLLFMDDHAMFIFRFQLLRENFPVIPFWSPSWNGGIDARDFFATGSLNTFLLAAPFFYLFGVEQSYNVVVALLLFVLVPAASYLAGRLLHNGQKASCIAATLSMCSSLLWYRWALKYGTMGFLVSTALLPLTVALCIRFISVPVLKIREMVLFISSTTLMVLWSLSTIALLPMAIVAIPYARTIMRSKRHVATIAILLALNLPWMAMMWKVSNLSRFVTSEKQVEVAPRTAVDETVSREADAATNSSTLNPDNVPSSSGATFRHRAGKLDPKRSLRLWQDSATSINPLMIILAIPALCALPRMVRASFFLTVAWLFSLGTFGVSLKPQLELDRMLVMGTALLALPIGSLIASMIEASANALWRRVCVATILAFLLTSPFSAAAVLFNRSTERYYFATPAIKELSDLLQTHTNGGRALFTGCVLHQLSNGHLAPLALWSNTPLIASSYAHNVWRYTQPIPPSFIARKDDGIRDYLDTMNVTTVLAHEPLWLKYFRSRPSEYEEIARVGAFVLFKRLAILPSYTMEGNISDLTHTSNSVSFVTNSEDVVLKFNYFPFLTSSHCAVSRVEIAPEIQFVRLSQCPIGERVTLSSVSPVKRFFDSGAAR